MSDGYHILPAHCGVVLEKLLMIWEVTVFLIAMETHYDAASVAMICGPVLMESLRFQFLLNL